MRGLRAAALALAALLAACGGGSGGSAATAPLPPPSALRSDLLFGYYYGRPDHVLEVADHANLYWVAADGGPAAQIAALQKAREAGIRNVVLMLPLTTPEGATPTAEDRRAWLEEINQVGALSADVRALYWVDEPDTPRHRRETAQIVAQNAILRAVMAEFPALAGAKLAVIYSCGGDRPGVAAFDWVGCDAYGDGCEALDRWVEPMRRALLPGQRLILVPGGADPWRQSPTCFEAYAHREPAVVAIVPFLWQTETDEGVTYRGIRENGMAPLYRAAGRRILGR